MNDAAKINGNALTAVQFAEENRRLREYAGQLERGLRAFIKRLERTPLPASYYNDIAALESLMAKFNAGAGAPCGNSAALTGHADQPESQANATMAPPTTPDTRQHTAPATHPVENETGNHPRGYKGHSHDCGLINKVHPSLQCTCSLQSGTKSDWLAEGAALLHAATPSEMRPDGGGAGLFQGDKQVIYTKHDDALVIWLWNNARRLIDGYAHQVVRNIDAFQWTGDLDAFAKWFGERMPIDFGNRISVPVHKSQEGKWLGPWLSVWCGNWIIRHEGRCECVTDIVFRNFIAPHYENVAGQKPNQGENA